MDEMGVSNAAGLSESPAMAGENPGDRLDLEALAEQIYRLLKEEARLERERLGGRRTW